MEDYMKQLIDKVTEIVNEAGYRPMTVRELEQALGIQGATEFKVLVKALVQMEELGLVIRTRRDRYVRPSDMDFVKGKVSASVKGYAFVIREEAGMDDIFIPAHELNGALNGDIVLVRLSQLKTGNRQEGSIVRVIERNRREVVGTFVTDRDMHFVVPDDKKLTDSIFIPKQCVHGAVAGHKVVVRIQVYPDANVSAEGEVIRILGHKNDPGVDILSIICDHGLPEAFPDDVMVAANQVKEEITEQDLFKRRDLRDEVIVTIDGADAKDLDDAVTVKVLENGNYHLSVHIADVSHYIKEGSAIDREAFERGTSVYLVDRVIPMIPHRLSNGICSLNPQVDRLTLSCEMEIDQNGHVVAHEIFQSVIKTTERMTYADVNAILVDEDTGLLQKYQALVPMFQAMEQLASILRNKRMKRGAIDFDFKEAKVLVDTDGAPTDVVIRERSVAEKLIEEFMLVANETVAEHFHWLDVPFIYRIHEDPDEDRLQRFFEFILNFGLIVRGTANQVHPRALQEILESVSGKPEEMVVSKIMLRSMKQAKYDPESLGHFGLSAEFYTHFTSPIRRYPDLIVHRLIRTYLIEGYVDRDTQEKWAELLGEIATHSSQMERRSVQAERDVEDLKKAEFMADKIGEEFTGIISSITNFGIFIELPNTIEGLVHVTSMLDDYYHFNERNYSMTGERTGREYHIGDEVTIQVAGVDLEERTIDFHIVGITDGRKREKAPTKIFKVNQDKGVQGKRPKKVTLADVKREESDERKDEAKKKSASGARKARKKNPFYENAPSAKRTRKKSK